MGQFWKHHIQTIMVGGGTEIATDSLGPVCKVSPENVLKWQKSLQVDESLRIKIFTYKKQQTKQNQNQNPNHTQTRKISPQELQALLVSQLFVTYF